MVYCQGTPFSTISIPLGGTQVSSDISIVKNISFETAERIKTEAGCCWMELLEEKDEEVIIPGVGGRPPLPIPRSQIAAIIQPRMEEIFRMVKERLDNLTLSRPLGGGIVLTGGGADFMGVTELAGRIFKMPIRIGSPLPLGGLVEEYCGPEYATAVGLVLEGDLREKEKSPEWRMDIPARENGQESFLGRIMEWFKKELF
jgi:cell division protein FtsA